MNKELVRNKSKSTAKDIAIIGCLGLAAFAALVISGAVERVKAPTVPVVEVHEISLTGLEQLIEDDYEIVYGVLDVSENRFDFTIGEHKYFVDTDEVNLDTFLRENEVEFEIG